MPPDPNELIHIKHPQVKTLGGPVTRQALDEVFSHNGWTAATEADVAKAAESDRLAGITGATSTAAAGKEKG